MPRGLTWRRRRWRCRGPRALVVLRRRFGDRARGIVADRAHRPSSSPRLRYALFLRAPGRHAGRLRRLRARTFTQFFLLAGGARGRARRPRPRRDVGASGATRRSSSCSRRSRCSSSTRFAIVPEHFWMARRFAARHPARRARCFAAAAALGADARAACAAGGWRGRSPALVFLLCSAGSTRPPRRRSRTHVEYAGIIPTSSSSPPSFGDRDLVIVESRDAGTDTHVLRAAARVHLRAPRARARLAQARQADARRRSSRTRSRNTSACSSSAAAAPTCCRAASARRRSPMAACRCRSTPVTPWNVVSRGRRGARTSTTASTSSRSARATAPAFSLDVGDRDDLNVVRFHAKETSEGRTIRWTGRAVASSPCPASPAPNARSCSSMHDGGRPAAAPPAQVDRARSTARRSARSTCARAFSDVPTRAPGRSRPAAPRRATDPAQLPLESTVWTPRDFLGGTDDRVSASWSIAWTCTD